jgi:zinc transporter, ZIP family
LPDFGVSIRHLLAGSLPLRCVTARDTVMTSLLGQHFVSVVLSIAFLGLAAGSILYVVIELLAVARKAAVKTVTAWGIFNGLILGFATDAVLTAAGA